MDLAELWKIALAQMEVKLDSPAQFKTWFKDTRLLDVKGATAVIGVKNSYTSDWLQKKHMRMIRETLSYVYGSDLQVTFEIDKSLVNKPSPKITAEEIIKEAPMFTATYGQENHLEQTLKNAGLNSNYSFANYIVGPSNKLGHAAAVAVATKPGDSYNPLFIYGKTGLGKTHLAQAIARDLLETDPYKKVLYVSSEGFLNDMVKAIRSGKNIQFRQKYRTLDLLIIDDIQFISKWQETQNEFFNTFNVLYNDKKQIVLISDRSPDEIDGIEDRLRSRFQGGMTVDISKPDFEMRLAIIENKARMMGISLPMNVYEFIAKHVTENVRELEGSLQKISLYSSMVEEELTLEEVAKILGKDTVTKREKVKVPSILKHVSREFNITVKDLKGPRRTADIAFARQVCMYILREDFGYKLEQVAMYMNRKDHTTVLHAVDKIKSKLMIDDGFKNQVDMLREAIQTSDL
ncbi:MAG: Chromosomal replication initiator protein DnaA [candidate division WS6 bacterium OLB20]|uniref:Chromosomal replication initiator protein DnaA n=1 Tax=candidate division WS6 bacterium OLB20 TaxID=1617426 RepID=A0A136LZA8_9BACT|nr:MAG: Chromosomal replication initiator protein DnaA [candidate division WS6 bacterium OLB20]